MGPVGAQATANSQMRLYGVLAPVGWLPQLVVRRSWSSAAVGRLTKTGNLGCILYHDYLII